MSCIMHWPGNEAGYQQEVVAVISLLKWEGNAYCKHFEIEKDDDLAGNKVVLVPDPLSHS